MFVLILIFKWLISLVDSDHRRVEWASGHSAPAVDNHRPTQGHAGDQREDSSPQTPVCRCLQECHATSSAPNTQVFTY